MNDMPRYPGFPFQSPLAMRMAQLACLGFLGALGFIPGWHKLFGFTGFFGFFGVAFIIEAIYWFRHRSVS
jgi:hypothetical protein